MAVQPKLERFKKNVLSKFQIYNSIFMTLPFDQITKTGVLLPLFHETCEKGYAAGDNPSAIVEMFFQKYQARRTKKSQIKLLFRFIQYIERQVVLFDAIEDAAFPVINNMDGIGTLRSLKEKAFSENKIDELKAYLDEFKVRIVLTAHPTQFYPGSVLGIITDLTEAIKDNDLSRINNLLAQLGKTPFFKHKKPTPYDEAVNLIWYLENVFYDSFGSIFDYIQQNIYDHKIIKNEIINIGFWPGGDRDGNPFVLPDTTLKVAGLLQKSILKNYAKDLKKLRRKLTFRGVEDSLNNMIANAYSAIDKPGAFDLQGFLNELKEVRKIVKRDHHSLYLSEITSLINKIQLFGHHFATLDIRQDSRIHHSVFSKIVEKSKERALELADQLSNALIINGDGRNVELLEEENINAMDAFISVTGNSETNIMSCLVAKSKGVKKTIALVENMDYFALSHSIGVDTLINKKLLAANSIFRYVRKGEVVAMTKLANMKAELLEFVVKPTSRICYQFIKEVDFPRAAIIGVVIRNESGIIALGDFKIEPGDRVVVCCLPEAISKVERLFF